MRKATAYPAKGVGTIIAPSSFCGYCQVYAIKERAYRCFINRTKLTVGYMAFIPGEWYPRFGSNKKTSAGYIYYDGEPLQFVGTYRDNALFVREGGPFEYEEFQLCYFSWSFSRRLKAFFATNHACAGRVMEMNKPPSGPSLFVPDSQK